MNRLIRLSTVTFVVLGGAQAQAQAQSPLAFEAVSSQERGRWSKEETFEARKHEFYALGREISIRRMNLTALSRPNVTLHRGNDLPPLQIRNSRVENASEDPMFWPVRRWRGEVIDPQTKETKAFEVRMNAVTINEQGETVFPDPNRPLVDAALADESAPAVLPKSSWERRNERVVWTARGTIQVPWERAAVRIKTLGNRTNNRHDLHVVYNIDPTVAAATAPIEGNSNEPPENRAARRQDIERNSDHPYPTFIRELKAELNIAN